MAKVRFSELPTFRSERLRDLARAIAMFPVRRFPKEIWAIGSRAAADYRSLVGGRIPVRNLPYFSDLDRFVSAGTRRERGPRVRFLFCNSLIARKGFDAVCDAVAILAREGREFDLVVAGKGRQRQKLTALEVGERVGIDDRGFLQLDRVPDVYADADVLLYPSRHDGWGMGIAEGMAAAMPAISTVFAGAAVDLIDERCGVLLEAVSGSAIASAMRRFIEEPALIAAMGAAAQQSARRFDHRAGGRRFLDTIAAAL